MSTLYLHVGTPKTGTSAIQCFCGTNKKVLSEKGFIYPNLSFQFENIGKNRNAHFLSHKIYQKKKRNYEEEEKLRETGFERIEALFKKYNNVVLSDEHIWNETEMDTQTFQKIDEKVKSMGAQLKIIVYLRRQDLLVQSYWAQQVKEGLQMGFMQYIEQKKYSYFKLDYEKRLKEIAEAVGKENIIVRVYEKGQYEGGTIISDFLHLLGLELTDDFNQEEMIHNLSLSGKYLELKRVMNQYSMYRTKMNFLVKALTKLQKEDNEVMFYDSGVYFSEASQKKFLEQFVEGNATIAREYCNHSDRALFKEPLDNNSTKEVHQYTSEEMIELLGRAFAKQEETNQERIQELVDMVQEERMMNVSGFTRIYNKIKRLAHKK